MSSTFFPIIKARGLGFQTVFFRSWDILKASYSKSLFFAVSMFTCSMTEPFPKRLITPFLSLCLKLQSRTNISYPKNLALSCAFVIRVFSSESSNLSFSAMNLAMSALIVMHSVLLPIIPIKKSSAYLTYWIRLYSVSIGS